MRKIIFHLAALISVNATAGTVVNGASEVNSSLFRIIHASSGTFKENIIMRNEMAITNDAVSFTKKQYENSGNHVVKFKGIADSDGRYVKYSYSIGNSSETICASRNIQLFFYTNHLGAVTGRYFICTDVLGTQCEPLSTDSYTVISQGNDIMADPREYTVDLSKVSDKYPPCTIY